MLRKVINRVLNRSEYQNLNIALASEFIASRNIEGDYLEFGVNRGDSFICAYRKLRDDRQRMIACHRQQGLPLPENLRENMRFFAFDSFEGLPPAQGADLNSKLPSHWVSGSYRSSRDTFIHNLEKAGVDVSDVVVIEGWYDKTLTVDVKEKYNLRRGALFHIDCDLYESARTALEFITDLYVDGSVIIFDDWFGFRGNPNFGEQRAFHEWQTKYSIKASEFSRCDGHSIAFILHKD